MLKFGGKYNTNLLTRSDNVPPYLITDKGLETLNYLFILTGLCKVSPEFLRKNGYTGHIEGL